MTDLHSFSYAQGPEVNGVPIMGTLHDYRINRPKPKRGTLATLARKVVRL